MLKPGNYDLIEENKKKKTTGAHVGSTVVLRGKDGEETTYTIVGSQEANILEYKISNESPLGKSILGKNPGDAIVFQSPGGTQEYSLISVH